MSPLGARSGTESLCERIARTLYLRYADNGGLIVRRSGGWDSEDEDFRDEFRTDARAVIEMLGLREEVEIVCDDGPRYRYVTDWKRRP